MKTYKVGIDVGGTFTKAIVIDTDSNRIVGKGITHTTYNSSNNIADGIVRALRIAVENSDIHPDDISLVAFSTTHTVNALLEGDVATVGIVALAPSKYAKITIKRTNIRDIKITEERKLSIVYKFINTDDPSYIENAESIVKEMVSKGARSFVVTSPFAIENPEIERSFADRIRKLGYMAVCGHEMSNLYGLEVRTITAAINASILPRMVKVADSVEKGVRSLGIKAPIMVMRGDGGVTSIDILRKKPLQTILSGPAASIIGALHNIKIDDAVFIEVGGTSTNIGVIKGGKPVMSYVKVMGYPTSIRSIDVHIGGIAGGSMVRVQGRKIIDVGPRSAHIAGLPYSSFTDPRKLDNVELVFISPRDGDPEDYAVLRNTDTGELYAITTTCAANALDIIPDQDFAKGYIESARKAMRILGEYLGLSIEDTANAILRKAVDNIFEILKHVAKEHKLKLNNTHIIGGGGAASVLVPYLSRRYRFNYKVSEHPEYISALGMLIGLVREEMEVTLPSSSTSIDGELDRVMSEIYDSLMSKGADPETITIDIEYDHSKSAIRVIGTGYIKDHGDTREKNRIGVEDVVSIVSKGLGIDGSNIVVEDKNRYYYIVGIYNESRSLKLFPAIRNRNAKKRSIVVIDKWGRIRLKLNNSSFIKISSDRIQDVVTEIERIGRGLKEAYIVSGYKIIDLSFTFSIDIGKIIDILKLHRSGSEDIYIIFSR